MKENIRSAGGRAQKLRLVTALLLALGAAGLLLTWQAQAEPEPGSVEGVPGVSAGPVEDGAGRVEPVPPVVAAEVECSFEAWVGRALDEEALKETGRPYRILKPGDMMTMDYNPERINVETDEKGAMVTRVSCG